MADNNIGKKTWAVVTITVAVIGCVGSIVAALIGRPEPPVTPTPEVPSAKATSAQNATPRHSPTALPQVSDFDDWQVPSGHDGIVEYRRCSSHPTDNFPVFDVNTPGYIHLIPQSAERGSDSYTWCFEVRSTGQSSNNLAVYFCAPPASGFCAEPGRVAIPREAVVNLDNGSRVLSPVLGNRNGVSIQSPRIIRVTMPGNTTQEPTITVGPYSNDGAPYIVYP